MHRRSRSPGTRSASPRIPSFQAKPGRQATQDLSSSNSVESPAVGFVVQHPQAPRPFAPQPIVDAPHPWPLPTPPAIPMMSDYSDQSPTSSVQGLESCPSPQTLNKTLALILQMKGPLWRSLVTVPLWVRSPCRHIGATSRLSICLLPHIILIAVHTYHNSQLLHHHRGELKTRNSASSFTMFEMLQ